MGVKDMYGNISILTSAIENTFSSQIWFKSIILARKCKKI